MDKESDRVVLVFNISVKVISVALLVLAIQYFEIREYLKLNQLVHNVRRNLL